MPLNALFTVIQIFLNIYLYVLIASALISWLPELSQTQLGRILDRLTEPYLAVFRRFIRPVQIGGVMLDVSYIVAFIVFLLIQQAVVSVFTALLQLA